MSFAFTLPRIPYWIALEPRATLDLCLHDEMFSSCMNTCSCPRIQLATLFAASFLLLTTFSCSSLMCRFVSAKAFDPFCWRLSFRDSRLRRSDSSTLALTVEPSENVIWVETPISKPMVVSGTNFLIHPSTLCAPLLLPLESLLSCSSRVHRATADRRVRGRYRPAFPMPGQGLSQ